MKSLFIWTCMFFCVFSNFAQADIVKSQPSPAKQTILTYDVYAGGIHALNAKLTLRQETSKAYDVALTAETRGLLKQLANWSGKFSSNGVVKGENIYPRLHQSASTWKGKTESKTFKYDGKGNFVSYKVLEAEVDKTPKDADLSLAKGTTDILSSTFRLMIALPKTKQCDGKELIFDGDRNFRLTYTNTKAEKLTKNDYNIYEGEAVSCNVEVIPEKGKWRKKPRGWLSIQEQGRNKGALPTVWFGKLDQQGNVYVPVKIKVTTDYGVLFMHLTSAKSQ